MIHQLDAATSDLGALMQLRLSGSDPIPAAVSSWVRNVLLSEGLAAAMEDAGSVTVHLKGSLEWHLAALPLAVGLAAPSAFSYRSDTTEDRVLPERPRVLYLGASPRDEVPLDLLSDQAAYLDAWSTIECTFDAVTGGLTRELLFKRLQASWDVVHITAHAAPGAVLVEDELGYSQEVRAADLADALPDGVVLLTIASCAGSQSTTASIASRTRARLHGGSADAAPSDLAGLMAIRSGATVIATRQEIDDLVAQRHFAHVVRQIVEGVPPSSALTSLDSTPREALNLLCWRGSKPIGAQLQAGSPKVTVVPITDGGRLDGREVRAVLLHAATTPAEKAVAATIAAHLLPELSVVDWAVGLVRSGQAVPLLETLDRHDRTWEMLAQLGAAPRNAAKRLRQEVEALSAPLRETLDLLASLDPDDCDGAALGAAGDALGHDTPAVLRELHGRGLAWPSDTPNRWATTVPPIGAISVQRWREVHHALAVYWGQAAEASPSNAVAWLARGLHLHAVDQQPAAERALVNACLHGRTLDPGRLGAAANQLRDSPGARLVKTLTAIGPDPVSSIDALGSIVPALAESGAADFAEIAAAERVDAAFRIGSAELALAIDQYEAHMGADPFSQVRLEFYRLRSEVRIAPDAATANRLEQVAARAANLASTGPMEKLRTASLAEALWDLADDLARARGDWAASLELTDKIATSRRERRAPSVEVADALLNQYGPLLMLEEVGAASLRLRLAHRAFEAADDMGGVTRVLAAQAQVAHRRGNHDEALSLAVDAASLAGDPIAAGAAHATIARWSTPDPRSPTRAAQHHMLFAAAVLSSVGAAQARAAIEDLALLGMPQAATMTELLAGLPLSVAAGAKRLCLQLGVDRLDAALGRLRESFAASAGHDPDIRPLVDALSAARTDELLAALVTTYLSADRPAYFTDDRLREIADHTREVVPDNSAVDQFVADLIPVSLLRVVAVLCERTVLGLDDSDVRQSLEIASRGGHRSALARSLLAALDGVRDPSRLLSDLQTPHAAAVVRTVRVLDGKTPIEAVAPSDAHLAAMADQARAQAAVAVQAARVGAVEALAAESLLARLAADPDTAPLAATLASLLDDGPTGP